LDSPLEDETFTGDPKPCHCYRLSITNKRIDIRVLLKEEDVSHGEPGGFYPGQQPLIKRLYVGGKDAIYLRKLQWSRCALRTCIHDVCFLWGYERGQLYVR
jgi:hypothetical protein